MLVQRHDTGSLVELQALSLVGDTWVTEVAQFISSVINLLYASPTIPLVCVISRASDEHPVVARPWPGGEKRIGGRASHHEEFEALGSFLLPCAATGMTLLAVRCLIGATPRGQPWTPAVTLLQG